MEQVQKPSFREAFLFWFKLGWISFGGPAGQIAIMHAFLVEKKKWISETKFLHALNYCMLLPGPEAQQLATYTGWLLHGTRGGLAAGILFILPSVFILLVLSIIYVSFGNLPWVNALFAGLQPAVVAIVLVALLKIGKKSLITSLHIAVAAISFIAIYFFKISFPIIILATILLGVIIQRWFPALLKKSNEKATQKENETSYYLTTSSVIPHTVFKSKRLAQQIVLFCVLWILPLLLFYFFSPAFGFWKQLSLFFSQSAFVTFGGAYAVLPYVAQQAVEQFQWLTGPQMIDGLALGETTPGPLIMVLAFVGFMGAYNNFGANILLGTLGLVTTTYYTFLPCFLFIFAGAPLIERTQQHTGVKVVLGFVTATITGVILNLTLYFAEAVIFAGQQVTLQSLKLTEVNWQNVTWILVSLVALYRFKVNMMLWLLISALFGLITHLIIS